MPGIVRANVDTHVGHKARRNPFHKTPYVAPGISVFANGEQVIRKDDKTLCGDKAVGNVSTVFAEGKPVHCIDHATSGHGKFGANKAKTGSGDVNAG
jgi:hypothetical protein|tara:strand:- start:848 stop:1138 length:291 start_codon:yes stop_codon:yes gene_type:complete